MKMPILRALSIALCLCLGMPLQAAPLTVAVAASLKYVFDDLAVEFKHQTGIETQSVFNASGKIATQIRQGAPFDVFMSADMAYPEGLYQDGYALSQAKPYAYGVLVLWTKKADIDLSQGVAGLTASTVKHIAIANPKVAPFGKQALEAMHFYKLREALTPKLVYGESIGQTSQYVDSKAVDVGFVAKSIVLAPEMAGRGTWVPVPAESYTPIAQGLVILRHGIESNADAARQFYSFVQSAKARAIFARYGYQLPELKADGKAL